VIRGLKTFFAGFTRVITNLVEDDFYLVFPYEPFMSCLYFFSINNYTSDFESAELSGFSRLTILTVTQITWKTLRVNLSMFAQSPE